MAGCGHFCITEKSKHNQDHIDTQHYHVGTANSLHEIDFESYECLCNNPTTRPIEFINIG